MMQKKKEKKPYIFYRSGMTAHFFSFERSKAGEDFRGTYHLFFSKAKYVCITLFTHTVCTLNQFLILMTKIYQCIYCSFEYNLYQGQRMIKTIVKKIFLQIPTNVD